MISVQCMSVFSILRNFVRYISFFPLSRGISLHFRQGKNVTRETLSPHSVPLYLHLIISWPFAILCRSRLKEIEKEKSKEEVSEIVCPVCALLATWG